MLSAGKGDLVKRIIFLLFEFTLKIRWLFGAACILAWQTKRVNGDCKRRILVLTKSVFSLDVDRIVEDSPDISFLMFPRLWLSEIVKLHTDRFDELNDGSYHTIMAGTRAQKRIRKDMAVLLRHLRRLLQFDVIFAGNYVYVSQQEFFFEASKADIPIITLYKEGIGANVLMTPEISRRMYSGKLFVGDLLLCYNEVIRDTLLDADIPGLTADNVRAVGIPRFDRYFEGSNATGEGCVLFAYSVESKAKRFLPETENWAEFADRLNAFQTGVIRYAVENPDFTLRIKTKADLASRSAIDAILKNLDVQDCPDNIHVTSATDAGILIEQSEWVASCLSTTIIEAAVLNRKILCPFTADLTDHSELEYFPQHLLNAAEGYSDIAAFLSNQRTSSVLTGSTRDSLLAKILFLPDGRAGKRVGAILAEYVATETTSQP